LSEVFAGLLLKMEKKQFLCGCGPKKCLRCPEKRHGKAVVFSLKQALALGREAVDELGTPASVMLVSGGDMPAFFECQALGFDAHVAHAEADGDFPDGEPVASFQFVGHRMAGAAGLPSFDCWRPFFHRLFL
jgi:hypothetical protein